MRTAETVINDYLDELYKNKTYLQNPMFLIQFWNVHIDKFDETEFSCEGDTSLNKAKKEILECWKEFCKENFLSEECIYELEYNGEDNYYNGGC